MYWFIFRDVSHVEFKSLPENVQNLICKADRIGWSTQVNTDGYTPNRKLNLAMGLAAIHVSQVLEVSLPQYRISCRYLDFQFIGIVTGIWHFICKINNNNTIHYPCTLFKRQVQNAFSCRKFNLLSNLTHSFLYSESECYIE